MRLVPYNIKKRANIFKPFFFFSFLETNHFILSFPDMKYIFFFFEKRNIMYINRKFITNYI